MFNILNILFIIFLCICISFNYNNFTDRFFKSNNNAKYLTHIIPPTIINDQSYSFIKTKYKNISFLQVIRSNDYISNHIKATGKWHECQDLYNLYISGKGDGAFIDFGANIGSCSFLFAESHIKVYAFEPLPNNLFPFSLTTFINPKYSQYITIYPYALGNRDEIKKMRIVKNNWGFSSFHYHHNDYVENIEVKKLDHFCNVIPAKIALIKIDVEGSEYELFEGGKMFFKEHKAEFIHIETECGKKYENGKYEIERMFNLLNSMGYTIIKKFNCSHIPKSNIIAKKI